MKTIWVVLSVLCGVGALAVLVQIIRDRLVNRPILWFLGLIGVGTVVNLVAGIGQLGHAPAGMSTWTWIGYLVASVIVLPLAVAWSWAERTRGGTAVILAGLVVLPYLFLRLHLIWEMR